MTEAGSADDTGIITLSISKEWVEVSLTAEEFAKWNGYFRSHGRVPVQLWISDFTIVK